MEELFISQVLEAIKLLFGSIDWFFVVVFMAITWIVTEIVNLQESKWKKSIITAGVAVFGIILASLYAYVYDVGGKSDIADLFYSVMMGMIIYKIGIYKIVELIKKKFNGKTT
jgi:hypothetical protein